MDDEAEGDEFGILSIESLRAQNPHLLPHFQSVQLFNREAQRILNIDQLGHSEVNARHIMPSEIADFQYPRWVDLVSLGIPLLQHDPGSVDVAVSDYAVQLLFFTWSSSTALGANGTDPSEISDVSRNYLREMLKKMHARIVADELTRPSRQFSQEQLQNLFIIVTCGLYRQFPNPFLDDTQGRPPAAISLTAPLAPPAPTSAGAKTEHPTSPHSMEEAASRAKG